MYNKYTNYYQAPFDKYQFSASTHDNFSSVQQNIKEYSQLMLENQWLKNEISKKYQYLIHQTKQHNFPINNKLYGQNHTQLEASQNDIWLRQIKNRNKYLEEKNYQLKKQYMKQQQNIRKIQCSEKWQNKFKCCPGKCYHKKYIQLLRVKSPLL